RLAVFHPAARLLAGEMAAAPAVFRRQPCPQRVVALLLEVFFRAEAVVRLAARHQLHRMRAVDVQPLGLPVRAMIATGVRTLIPVESEPAQIVERRALGLLGRARDVGVLDAKDERTARAAGEQPVEERGARVADVQLSGGAWSESETHFILGGSAFGGTRPTICPICPRRARPRERRWHR